MSERVSVVILNWNGWRDTLQCITSLRHALSSDAQVEYIVVDNGSDDDSVSQLRAQPGLVLIELPDNTGFARGSNAGIMYALGRGCDHILLMNNDTLAVSDLLTPMLDVFHQHIDAGIVAPKVRFADEPDRIWYAGGRLRQPRLIGDMIGLEEVDAGQHDNLRVVDFAVGCCMLVRKDVFEEIGYFDERFFFYQEDVDFSLRTTRAGFSVWYQPAAMILHKVSRSTEDNLSRRTFLYAESRMIFFAKHIRGPKVLWVAGLELVRLVRMTGSALWRRQPDIASSYIRGVLAGLAKARQCPQLGPVVHTS